MKKNIKAKDIMTSNPIVLSADMPIEKALSLLSDKNIQGSPVIDTKGSLVGFLSVHDIMVDLWCQYYSPNKGQVVSDLMNKELDSIEANESLFNIIELLCIDKKQLYPTSNMGIGTANHLSSVSLEQRAKETATTKHQILPVLDQGVLVGVITRVEITKALCPIYTETNTPADELACA